MSDEIKEEKPLPRYEKNTSEARYFCRTHRRQANSILYRKGMEPTPVCDPGLGGIMACCDVYLY